MSPGTGGTPRRAPRRADVLAQAAAMVEVARVKFGDNLEHLRNDPCGTLAAWDEVEFQFVAEVEEAEDGATPCSVAGAYIEDLTPGRPLIQVARAASEGRRAFTALHELGHHLQRNVIELLEVTWDQPDSDLFEDYACDAFAAATLLPDDDVSRHIGGKGPTADDIIGLQRANSASRSAVCVRAAQRLPAPGHVLLLTDEGEVFFSSSRDLPPLRRGSDQSAEAVIERGLTTGRSSGRGRFSYRDDIRGDELLIQTASFDGDLLVVVAVTDSAPWEQFALPSKDVGPQAGSYECSDPACGATYNSWERRCTRCAVPPCSECGRCSCTSTPTELTCGSCWTVQPSAGFVGDICADCA